MPGVDFRGQDKNIGLGIVTADDFQTGVGISLTALQADVVQRAINAKSAPYNASGGGVTDDYSAIQAAITAAANGVLIIPYGTYMISAQLVNASPLVIWNFGILKPSTTGVAGTSLFKTTSSNTHIFGFGVGMIDGNSKLWCGIHAESTTAVLENITVQGMRFQNIAINSTSATVINFGSVKNGKIIDNWLYNSGVVGNVAGGGVGVYAAFNQNTKITGNYFEKVGSTSIESPSGVGNIVGDNNFVKSTLFHVKGGYGGATTVTSNAASTTTTFTIAKSSATTKQWFVGQGFVIIEGNTTLYHGTVKSITDNSTYYTITTMVAMTGAPTSGKTIYVVTTDLNVHDNTGLYSGDNGVDMNVVINLSVKGNHFKFSGLYRDVGTFAGLNCGIWVGADDQGAVTCLQNYGVLIEGNTVEYSGGSGICAFNSNNITASATNIVKDYNLNNTSGHGGIDLGRVGSNRTTNVMVDSNLITAGSGNGYGVFVGYFTNGKVSSNIIKSPSGIKMNSAAAGDIEHNLVEATANSAYAILISDDGGAATSGVQVKGNNLRCNGTGTTGIGVTDTGATGVKVTTDNFISAVTKYNFLNTAGVVYDEHMIITGTTVAAALNETKHAPYRVTATPAQVKVVAQFWAHGGVEILGIATDGVNAEMFRVYGWGGAGAVSFTSIGVMAGVAFLAAGDFTVVVNGGAGLRDFKYTNNEGTNVLMNVDVRSISSWN